jgi:hypothetical protein
MGLTRAGFGIYNQKRDLAQKRKEKNQTNKAYLPLCSKILDQIDAEILLRLKIHVPRHCPSACPRIGELEKHGIFQGTFL